MISRPRPLEALRGVSPTMVLVILAGAAGAIAVAAMTIAIIAVVGLSDQTKKLGDQTDRVTDVVAQIQFERRRNTLTSCLDQNGRHDRAVKQLDDVIAALPPARRQAAAAGRASTVLLIDAIAPRRDCESVAAAQVAPEIPKP